MREIRRQDRVLDDLSAQSVIANGEYGVLSMVNADGGGYGIPLNYAVAQNGDIYFHCAPQGHKLENLELDNRVTFTIVGTTKVIAEKFTTHYQSVVLFGTIESNLPEQERKDALWLIAKKYSPDYTNIAEKYINGSFHRTNILKLCVEHYSSKTKK